MSENEKLEFKDYSWPFVKDKNLCLEFTLLKTICSFLNTSGGTILIGVDDDRIIQGVKIKSISEVKDYIDGLESYFYPNPSGLIKSILISV